MKLFLTVLLVLTATPALAQDTTSASGDAHQASSETGDLTVVFTGFGSDDGVVLVRIDSSKATFLQGEDFFRATDAEVEGGKAEVIFEAIPYGTYAISAVHDENSNGKMDQADFGIPLEAYGFSNNARGQFGPPTFEASAFAFTPDSATVTIEVK